MAANGLGYCCPYDHVVQDEGVFSMDEEVAGTAPAKPVVTHIVPPQLPHVLGIGRCPVERLRALYSSKGRQNGPAKRILLRAYATAEGMGNAW